jgi:hypothetical protein
MKTITASAHNQIFVYETRKMGRVGNIARMEAIRWAFRVLMGKPEGKRLL